MSVITESLINSPLVIISNFVACEHGKEFDWNDAREFNIGEVVYYIGSFKNENIKQEHLQWFVMFQTEEGSIYSAIQLYFVCEYEWKKIMEYFNHKNS